VKNGQTVKKGDLLVRLDNEDTRIDLDAAKIRLDECSRKLNACRIWRRPQERRQRNGRRRNPP